MRSARLGDAGGGAAAASTDLQTRKADPHLRLEAVAALGARRRRRASSTRCSTCSAIRARRSVRRRCGRWRSVDPEGVRDDARRGSIPIRTGACGRRWRRCSARCRPRPACRGCGRCSSDTDQRVMPAVLGGARRGSSAPDAATIAARAAEGRRPGRARGGGAGARRAEADRAARRRSPRPIGAASATRPTSRARPRWRRWRRTARRRRVPMLTEALARQGLGGARAGRGAAQGARSGDATRARGSGRRRRRSRREFYDAAAR